MASEQTKTYRAIKKKLKSKKQLNQKELDFLIADADLTLFYNSLQDESGVTSFWASFLHGAPGLPNAASKNKTPWRSYSEFINAHKEDTSNATAKAIYKNLNDTIKLLEPLRSKALTITPERWLQAVTKSFPELGYKATWYTLSELNWDLDRPESNPNGLSKEQLKKNVVDKAKQNKPNQMDQEFSKFLKDYVSVNADGEITATLRNITVTGKNMEGITDEFYSKLSRKYPVDAAENEEYKLYYDIYDWAGGAETVFYGQGVVEEIPVIGVTLSNPEEEAQTRQAQVAGNAPKPAEGEETDYNFEEIYQYVDQCVLLTYIKSISDKKKTAEKAKTAPYNNTTIKITSATPELTINRFLLPKRLYTFFGKTGAEVSQGHSKVYRVGQPNATGSAYREIQFTNVVNDHTKTLSLKGTNPSTARADIKFDLTFKMNNFQDIKSNELLFSLLERPGFVANGTGFNRWYRNQYHPSYYKKSLIYDIKKEDTTTGEKKDLFYGFDTTLVDHNITFDESKSGEVSVNLDSMAYSEALMNLPYLDVLAGRGGHEERKKRESIIEAAVASGCTEETLDELRRSIGLQNKGLAKGAKKRIVQRIINLGLMSTLEIDYAKVKQIYENGVPDNVKNLQTAAGGPTISIWSSSTNPSNAPDQEAPEEDDFEVTSSTGPTNNRTISFFTLSDLITVCSEMFFASDFGRGGMHDTIRTDYSTLDFPGFEPQFLTFDFNYKSLGLNKVTRINCGDIPIAVSWFSKFMNDQYYSKDMDYVPIGVFLRDITEKAFTQLISEVCFSNELESKVHFRVSFFKGRHGVNPEDGTVAKYPLKLMNDPKANEGFLDDKLDIHNEVPYFCYGQDIGEKLGKGNDETIDDDDKFTETDLIDYIVIHPYTQTYTSTNIDKEVADYLVDGDSYNKKNDNGCIPVIRSRSNVGGDFQTYTNVKEMNFKKVEGKYLREQRMFYFNDNAFLAIGNVYDVDITLRVIMPWFTPGMYIIVEPFTGDNMHWNNPNSIGYQLGMAGMYVIISVEHKTTTKDYNGDTVLHCKWVNSAIDKGNLRVKEYVDKKGIQDVPDEKICGKFDELDDQIILSGKDIDTLLTEYTSISTKIDELGSQSGNVTGNQVQNSVVPNGYTSVDATHFLSTYGMTAAQVTEMEDIINDDETRSDVRIGNFTHLGLNGTAIPTSKNDVIIEAAKVKLFKVAKYTTATTGGVTESNVNEYLIYNSIIYKKDP
jgi:hypothetical protein